MLNQYQTNTQRLLQNPGAPTSLYALTDITSWINTARNQIAGDSVSVRQQATISTVVGQAQYRFEDIDVGPSATNGVEAVLNVSNIRYASGNGTRWIETRPWAWFSFYHLNNPVPQPGPPTTWSVYGQGAAEGATGSGRGGTFYIDPSPDDIYVLTCDCQCLPQPLAADADVEAIPYPWTDCVPYLAAWYALLSSQTGARQAEAERMYNYYEEFRDRARKFTNPDLLKWQGIQGADIAQGAKFGIKPGGGGQ